MIMKRLCCFFNYNPHYRFPIYHAMDEEMNCDFFFGDSVFEPLKQFDPSQLNGFKRMFHTIKLVRSYQWHKDIWTILNKYSDFLITGQYEYLSYWVLIIYAKLTGKRVYCWTHGVSQNGLKQRKARIINKLFFSSMDGILLYNRYKIPHMKQLGISEQKMFVIHNSLETELQTKIYNQLTPSDIYSRHFQNELPTIIYIGRIQTRKKLDLLVEAIARINTPVRRVNTVIVGKEADEHTVQEKVRSLEQENAVWFFGPCFDEEKNAELIYNATVCVCPAEVGLTAIHALSYGTPVISNDDFEMQMPEFEAIKDGKTGSFYKTDNIQDLADKIEQWISLNPIKRDETRNESRKEIEYCWSVKYQIEILKSVFPKYMKQV